MQSTQQFVARAIRVQCVRSGIQSDAELARRAGVTPSWLSKRLAGDIRMSLEEVDRLAKALDTDPFALMSLARAEASGLTAA